MFQSLLALCFIGVEIVQGSTYTICRNGWMANEGSCYLFGHVEGPMTFTTAEEYCRHHSSHLVHVNNSDENDFLKDRMRQLKHFKPDDHAHNNEDCAIFDQPPHDFKWADAPCTIFKAVPVCEMSGWTDPEIVLG
ncbi:C-type lectin domain family 4 member G-like [Mya arenaria]|uniref:C-type lectin domain family 4 member G-like n=1 Tax=Mya arenaria TaxID=6604 RepID=UPI0022E28132|nr:C-type lectin domain family 4 member G-like [Mya arenaria]